MQNQPSSFNIVTLALNARRAIIDAIPPEQGQGGPVVSGWPTLVCSDGFSMSVQAGRMKFSVPDVDGAFHYSHVEIAHTTHCDELDAYGDEFEGIYQFVPVDVVEKLLEKHGGLDIPATVAYRKRLLQLNRSPVLCD